MPKRATNEPDAAPGRLKIGLVLDDSLDKVDGVQQYVLGVGEWLRQQGHDVHYLVGETKRQDIANIHSLSRNLKVRFNGNRMTMPLPTSHAKLRRLLAEQHFDVLHVQLPHSPFMAHRLVLEADSETAVIGTFHIIGNDGLVTLATKVLGTWTRQSLRRFDEILAVTDAAGSFARKTFQVKTVTLPNVFNYPVFHKASPLAKYQDGVMNILFLGRLVPRKGCQLLLEAVAHLNHEASLPNFRVVICGKGPLAAKLQHYVAQQRLESLVEFVGFVSEADKPQYYSSADITVFPSTGGESFGIVLLEGMASGHAAVLAGDNPGYRSVMAPHPEFLFDPNNAMKLADRLKAYLTDGQLRETARAWGERYAAEFDIAVVGPRIMKVYRQALRKRTGQ
jgi:phosphatidylinositol alpha-mannosyltransferase